MKKKPPAKQAKVVKPVSNANQILTYQGELDKLLKQKDGLLVKIDELNKKISQAVECDVYTKVSKFLNTLNEYELNALDNTPTFQDIMDEFLQEECEGSFKD